MAAVPPAPALLDEAQELAFVYINRAACPTLQGLDLPTATAFDRVFDQLLGIDERHAVHLHFTQHHMNCLNIFLSQPIAYFSGSMGYRDPAAADPTAVVQVNVQDQLKCHQLIDFYNHNLTCNGNVTPDLENCPKNIFNYFVGNWEVARDYPCPSPPMPPPPGPVIAAPITCGTMMHTPLTDFQKGYPT